MTLFVSYQVLYLAPVQDGQENRHPVNMLTTLPSLVEPDALRSIVEGVEAETGDRFFSSLVRHLATALEAPYCFISELDAERHLFRTRTVGEGAPPTEGYGSGCGIRTGTLARRRGHSERWTKTVAINRCPRGQNPEPCVLVFMR